MTEIGKRDHDLERAVEGMDEMAVLSMYYAQRNRAASAEQRAQRAEAEIEEGQKTLNQWIEDYNRVEAECERLRERLNRITARNYEREVDGYATTPPPEAEPDTSDPILRGAQERASGWDEWKRESMDRGVKAGGGAPDTPDQTRKVSISQCGSVSTTSSELLRDSSVQRQLRQSAKGSSQQAHGDALAALDKVRREVDDPLHHPNDHIGHCELTVSDVRQALTASGRRLYREQGR